jgi:hypothetical protein
MSTKTREVIWGGRVMGAKMRAETARREARKAARAADRAEAEESRREAINSASDPEPISAYERMALEAQREGQN